MSAEKKEEGDLKEISGRQTTCSVMKEYGISRGPQIIQNGSSIGSH